MLQTDFFQKCSPCEHPRSLQEAEKVPSSLLRARARPPNRTTAYLQWIMSPRGLLHRKYAVVRAVARDTVNMQSIGLASIYGAPSDDLESENCFFKKASQLRSFFLSAFLPSSTWPRDTVNMQRIELASLFVAPSAFQNFGETDQNYFCELFDVVTGHRKNAVNRAGWPPLIFRTFSRWSRDTVNMQ